jgi:hypothetical protein
VELDQTVEAFPKYVLETTMWEKTFNSTIGVKLCMNVGIEIVF